MFNNFKEWDYYHTKSFSEIYEEFDSFKSDFEKIPTKMQNAITNSINDSNYTSDEILEVMYFLLVGRYGGSHIAMNNLGQWKNRFFSIIYTNAPIWIKRLVIQEKVRDYSIGSEKVGEGTTTIWNTKKDGTFENVNTPNTTSINTNITNHALNPSTSPSTNSETPLTYIDSQDYEKNTNNRSGIDTTKGNNTDNSISTQKTNLSGFDSILKLQQSIGEENTENFLNKFKPLFIRFLDSQVPYIYFWSKE